MQFMHRARFAAFVWILAAGAHAGTAASGCHSPEVHAHVRQLLSIYGPMSVNNEFFGFIYRHEARIDSGVVRGRRCALGDCVVEVALAADRIPPGAMVLGEWHTHPRSGSWTLSTLDVRGAYQNRHLECYAAYFSRPDGDIFAWDPRASSVPTAMASLSRIGTYAPRRG